MSMTRPPSLSPEEMQRLIDAVSRRGGNISMADPRLSALQNWLMVTIGTVLIVVGGWTITSINKLNETMVKVVEQNTALQRVNDAQDRRFDNIDRRIETMDIRLRDVERKP